MRWVWLRRKHEARERSHPFKETLRVLDKTPNGCDAHGVVAFPQTRARSAKIRDTGWRRDPGAGQRHRMRCIANELCGLLDLLTVCHQSSPICPPAIGIFSPPAT